VLPHLYAYRSVKHVCRIEVTATPVRASVGRLLSHPRARVDREERSGVGAQRFLRWLYRLLLPVFLSRALAADDESRAGERGRCAVSATSTAVVAAPLRAR
jgi:hypothetical protein